MLASARQMKKERFQVSWESKVGGLHAVEGSKKGTVKVATETGLGEGLFKLAGVGGCASCRSILGVKTQKRCLGMLREQ